jgi:hypothetical protein
MFHALAVSDKIAGDPALKINQKRWRTDREAPHDEPCF